MANNYRAKVSHRTAKLDVHRIDWASPQQLKAFKADTGPLCLSGGYGASKTFAGILKMLWAADQFPGNRLLIARKIWTELQKTTMATFFKLCNESAYIYGGRRSDTEKYLRLNNGSEILWAHLDSPETENMIQGLEINGFLIDQAEEVHEEIFEKLLGRLGRWDKTEVPREVIRRYEGRWDERWPWESPAGKPLPPTFAILTVNPDTRLHWIYRRFHEESPEHWERRFSDPLRPKSKSRYSYHDFGYRMIHMRSIDNKHLPEQNRIQLLSRDKTFIKRYVMGEWGMPEGTIHTINPKSLLSPSPEVFDYIRNNALSYHRSYDHGDTSPACCLWWAVDGKNNYFCYRQYYRGDTLITGHRRNIYTMSAPELDAGLRYVSNYADPSIFHKTMQSRGGRYSAADEYQDTSYDPETVIHWMEADNDEFGTRNRINELLSVDPERLHPITGEAGAPQIYFVRRAEDYPSGCYETVQQLESQRRLKIGMNLGRPVYSDERDNDIIDHAYDSIRYFIASRAKGSNFRKTKPIRGTFLGACLLVDRMNRQNSRQLSRVQRREAKRYGRL